jgi:hypothetical protein
MKRFPKQLYVHWCGDKDAPYPGASDTPEGALEMDRCANGPYALYELKGLVEIEPTEPAVTPVKP